MGARAGVGDSLEGKLPAALRESGSAVEGEGCLVRGAA